MIYRVLRGKKEKCAVIFSRFCGGNDAASHHLLTDAQD